MFLEEMSFEEFQDGRYGKFFYGSRASNSEVNDLTWPKFQFIRDFMPLLHTCKFEEVVIKTEGAMPRTMSNMFFITQGQVTLRTIVKYG